MKTRLFRYNLVGLFLNIVYVLTFAAVTLVARNVGWGPADTAFAWACVHLSLSPVGLLVGYRFSRKDINFKTPWPSIIKYLGASALMLGFMFPVYLFVPFSYTAAMQFVRIASLLAIGIATYFGAVILFDKEGREMVKFLFSRLGLPAK
jgi:hypothetical protein